MVFYFKARPEAGDYTIFMGFDKHENEELIKYGFPEDIWFHVEKMSSAHVYLRLHKGQTIDDISEGLLEDCTQLVKSSSTEGNKVNNVNVVYTPWQNLKKTTTMGVGQVGIHNSKMVRTVTVEKRINEIVNRLNGTKVERKPDLRAEREAVNAAERAEREQQLRDKECSSLMWWHGVEQQSGFRNVRCPWWDISLNQTDSAIDDQVHSIVDYYEKEEGVRVYRQLKRYHHKNIMKPRYLIDKVDHIEVIFDPLPETTLDAWISKSTLMELWAVDTKYEVVEGSYVFLKVYRGIVSGLDTLFSQNDYHGNLRNGVLVSSTNDVMLVHPSAHLDTVQGMKQDIEDFVALVSLATDKVGVLGASDKMSACIKLFFQLIRSRLNPCNSTDDLMQLWLFIKINPIFYGPVERYAYVRKLDEIKYVCNGFVSGILHQRPETTMQDWHVRVQTGTELHDVLTGSAGRLTKKLHILPWYTQNDQIFWFERCTYEHFRQERYYRGWVADFLSAEHELFQVFPDFVPKSFFEMVDNFYGTAQPYDRAEVNRMLRVRPYLLGEWNDGY